MLLEHQRRPWMRLAKMIQGPGAAGGTSSSKFCPGLGLGDGVRNSVIVYFASSVPEDSESSSGHGKSSSELKMSRCNSFCSWLGITALRPLQPVLAPPQDRAFVLRKEDVFNRVIARLVLEPVSRSHFFAFVISLMLRQSGVPLYSFSCSWSLAKRSTPQIKLDVRALTKYITP